MGIRAKHEWRRMKAQQRAGQAMVATGLAIIPAVVGWLERDRGASLLFTGTSLCLAVYGWIVARRASARLATTREETPDPDAAAGLEERGA